MKQKLFSIIILSVCLCINMAAQKKEVGSLTFSFGGVGKTHASIRLKEAEVYKYHYNAFWNINAGYEKQFKGVFTFTELSYSHGTFDNYELTGTSQWFDPEQKEDISSISLTQYIGVTINKISRFQIPLYFGIGGEYLTGGPLENFALHIAAKARMKYYFTTKIGMFVGINGLYGLGFKSASELGTQSADPYYTLSHGMWYFDAGLIIGL